MQSPGRRQNLLDPRWTHVGFGLHEAPAGRTFVAQVFAADPNPRSGDGPATGGATWR